MEDLSVRFVRTIFYRVRAISYALREQLTTKLRNRFRIQEHAYRPVNMRV